MRTARIAAAGVWIGAVCLLAVVPGPGAEEPALTVPTRRTFVRGGAEASVTLRTPWAARDTEWSLTSDAGPLATGRARTDDRAALALRLPVPDVRVPVSLTLTLVTTDAARAKHAVEVFALPRDPLADHRQSLATLGIGVLPGSPLANAATASGLPVTELQHDVARSQFRGTVVILGGLLGGDAAATRRYVESLPAGTHILLAADRETLTRNFPHLFTPADPPPRSELRVDAAALAWTDLPVEWIEDAPPTVRLGEWRSLLSLRVLAGRATPDGQLYPLLLQGVDLGGRVWLVWCLPAALPPDDPRWDLLLRNSLLTVWKDCGKEGPKGRAK